MVNIVLAMNDLEIIITQLKKAFENENVKRAVLQTEWLEKNIQNKINSIGFCYSASEVIYRLTGGKENWKKMSISKSKWKHGGHCYLMNKKTGERLDITSDQYTELGIKIPYELAVAGGFRKVSHRANNLSILAGLQKLEV